jgi:hypothetical protein
MSCEDYCPEIDNASDDDDYVPVENSDSSCEDDDAPPTADELIKELLDSGGIRMENIIEIQWIIKLIQEANCSLEQKERTGKCLETLINMANNYVNNFESLKLLKSKGSSSA